VGEIIDISSLAFVKRLNDLLNSGAFTVQNVPANLNAPALCSFDSQKLQLFTTETNGTKIYKTKMRAHGLTRQAGTYL